MEYPIISDVTQSKEILSYFAGYVRKLSCTEGSFYDEKNISTENFPMLSPRQRRGINNEFTNFQGMVDKDDLVWIDDGKLYINNVEQKLDSSITLTSGMKTIAKMGSYIIIFPDKVWFKTSDSTSGKIEASENIASGTSVVFQMVDADGDDISLWDGKTTLKDGDYKIATKDGKKVLMVYSTTTSMWVNVATTYFKISVKDGTFGKSFNKGDGVKVTVDLTDVTDANKKLLNYKNVFVNDEGDNKYSNNFVLKEKGDNYITVTGILGAASVTLTKVVVDIERKAPDAAFVCECQNRLWACSDDGHEVYCCKQGDPTNWNCFAGVSTDSWTATVGSDGAFTGAFAYLGYPIFFKEKSLLKITISSYGAHSYKEVECRGVQEGSEKSLVMLNELLYYKGTNNVCVYDGNFPQEIGDDLGGGRYKNAVGGSINNRYYLCMQDESDNWNLFTYDSNNSIWSKEDNVQAVCFARHDDDLYFVASNKLYSVYGTNLFGYTGKESTIKWMAESGWIGYSTTDKKYLSRLNVRMKLDVGSYVSLYIEYDSSGAWEHVWNVAGKGTKTFTIPVRPKRCDHYRLKFVGTGDAKVFSLAKSYEEGSDM